jgi:hypothetical protein
MAATRFLFVNQFQYFLIAKTSRSPMAGAGSRRNVHSLLHD